MKQQYIWSFLLIVLTSITACKKDNYSPPSSKLTGRIVYQGTAIDVEYGQVPFQLYQYGFGKTGAMESTFAPDGSFSASLFDGTYKFIIPNGQGPFQWKQTPSGAPDSVTIQVQGNKTIDIDVTPYFMIRSPQFTTGNAQVNTTFKIEQIITGAAAREVEQVSLYINKTVFVSGVDNIAKSEVDGKDIANRNNVKLSVNIPALVPAQNYIFARIGLKIVGVEDRIFSPVMKLSLQ
ncbi:DUF3823 domain-containing protein [Chitinophaga pendula]|nr:hypothetical protein CK934_21970 [Chitinophaga sp. MD30]UCJ10218.1 DUF3823 domain-containing protein [Chitinophaga pendula]